MKLYVQSTTARAPKKPIVRFIAVGLAAFFVILAVAQLYSFEDFPEVIASLGLPGGRPATTLLSALIVTGEVLAVPYLLSMRLSPAMRVVSMIAGWLIIAKWLGILIYVNVTTNAITNSGVLGATIPVAPEWWLVGLFTALGAALIWVSWGMWPFADARSIDRNERTR